MALDGIILSKVKENLDKYLPIRINRISRTSKTEIIFNVHANKMRSNLVMSLHSNYNHISFSNQNYSNFNDADGFVMLLRKHLSNGIIYKIEQFEYDRYLLLHIRNKDELYDEKHFILSLELMGKYANLILIDENNRIIDALKKIAPYESSKRTIIPGAPFTKIDSQNKQDPYNLKDIDLNESLVKQISGFSKGLEKEVRHRLEKESLEDIINDIKNSHSLYITKLNEGYDFHIIPLTYLNLPYEEVDINEGFEKVYGRDEEKERIKIISNDLFKVVKRQVKHFETKINKLEESLIDANNLLEDKENGDLLYTLEDLDKKGLKEIELVNFDGKNVLIKLDPKLSIKQNANKYYNTYQKKRKGKVYIDEQINIAKNELEYFNSLNEQLSFIDYIDALDIKEELTRYGYLKKTSAKPKKKKISLYRIEYKGQKITFGKNNLQNNEVSFEYAKKDYMWFHAKGYHGSHVVVDNPKPDEDTLRLCANIAAYFSKGRYSSSVPVDYCLVKDLKKIKGAKSGFVTFKNYKTIYIDPEEIKLNITSL